MPCAPDGASSAATASLPTGAMLWSLDDLMQHGLPDSGVGRSCNTSIGVVGHDGSSATGSGEDEPKNSQRADFEAAVRTAFEVLNGHGASKVLTCPVSGRRPFLAPDGSLQQYQFEIMWHSMQQG